MTAPAKPKAIIIGGGISGLVAAHEFVKSGWSVAVFEASSRWGGKLYSSPVGNKTVDAGPDSMLVRHPASYELCHELGLSSELTHPIASIPALINLGGQLHQLPAKTVLGVPTDHAALTTDTLTSNAIAKVAAEPQLGWTIPDDDDFDITIGALCRQRLGDEITGQLIGPLLGGINASDIVLLSLRSAAPMFYEALNDSGSLVVGLGQRLKRARRLDKTEKTPTKKAVFYGLAGGIARIIDQLLQRLIEAGAQLNLNSAISAQQLSALAAEPGVAALLLASPAYASAEMLGPTHPDTAELLAGIDYAGVAQATLEFPVTAFKEILDTAGILFPKSEGTTMTACTWLSSKWAHYQTGSVLLRLTAGRYGDNRIDQLDDNQLVRTLLGELSEVIEIKAEPTAKRVQRWPKSLPQYLLGHQQRVTQIETGLAATPFNSKVNGLIPIAVTGAAYHGIGIPACIAAAKKAAAVLIEQNGEAMG